MPKRILVRRGILAPQNSDPSNWWLAVLHWCVNAYCAADYVVSGSALFLKRLFHKRCIARHLSSSKNLSLATLEPADVEPDISVGPILTRADAPGLFEILAELAAQLDGAFPTEVRLSYLPACGVLDLRTETDLQRQVLIIGLPCFLILRVDELQAVLAHELAHLHLEHNDRVRKLADFGRRLPNFANGSLSPWERPRSYLAHFIGKRLMRATVGVSHAMEYRADELSADCYGARPLASALEKLAIVQPLFRETLMVYDPIERKEGSVYRFFATFWKGLDRQQYKRLRRRFVKMAVSDPFDVHPPIYGRIQRLSGPPWNAKRRPSPAATLLATPDILMTVMHNRLYGEHSEPDSVFQRFLDEPT